MISYTKNDFWVKKSEDTGKKRYFIRLKSVYVEVAKEVFDVCYYSYRKELRDRKKDIAFTSRYLDEMLHQQEDETMKNVNNKILMERINQQLCRLKERDQMIARLSMFEGLSDEQIAKRLNMKRSTVNYHKHKIYKILREQLCKIEEWL